MEVKLQQFLRKKILYLSSHRGNREMDLILSKFTEKFLDKMTLKQLNDYIMILEENDAELYYFISKKQSFPDKFSREITNKLLEFIYLNKFLD